MIRLEPGEFVLTLADDLYLDDLFYLPIKMLKIGVIGRTRLNLFLSFFLASRLKLILD